MRHASTLALAALFLAPALIAQNPVGPTPEAAREAGFVTRTFYLSSQMSQAEQNETLTALRNMLQSSTRIILVPSQNAVVVRGTAEQAQEVGDLIGKLDHPHRQYRLTYTFTDTDSGKRVGVQHYSMVLTAGERMQMKEGSRVPLITGSYTKSDQSVEKQTTYLDIGFNFDSVLQPYGEGVQLKSKIEQSSMAAEKSGIGPEDPIIRQTMLQGTSYLQEGKPLALGTLDVLGSTRRLEVEALVEAVR